MEDISNANKLFNREKFSWDVKKLSLFHHLCVNYNKCEWFEFESCYTHFSFSVVSKVFLHFIIIIVFFWAIEKMWKQFEILKSLLIKWFLIITKVSYHSEQVPDSIRVAYHFVRQTLHHTWNFSIIILIRIPFRYTMVVSWRDIWLGIDNFTSFVIVSQPWVVENIFTCNSFLWITS